MKKPSLNIGVIVAARMTSKRFPGKHLAILHGKPVLQWCLERCKQIHKGAAVILAVPDTDESEPLLELATSLGVQNFCGDENDVLGRLYHAAVFFKLDIIIRITGDCPFIDPTVCREVLALLTWRNLDYASNIYPTRTYPRGLDCEAFSMDCLEAAHKLAKTSYEREHVTPWMQNTAQVVKGNVTQQIDVSFKNFCVDEPGDIERIEKETPVVSMSDYRKNPLLIDTMNGTPTSVILPAKKDKIHD